MSNYSFVFCSFSIINFIFYLPIQHDFIILHFITYCITRIQLYQHTVSRPICNKTIPESITMQIYLALIFTVITQSHVTRIYVHPVRVVLNKPCAYIVRNSFFARQGHTASSIITFMVGISLLIYILYTTAQTIHTHSFIVILPWDYLYEVVSESFINIIR